VISFRTSQKYASTRIEEEPRRHGFSGQRYIQPASPPVAAPDLAEAADLYYRRATRGLAYLHFDSPEAAITFIRDNLSVRQLEGAVLQVGEHRYQGEGVAALLRRMAPRQATAKLDA
jgi:hypothetical protein